MTPSYLEFLTLPGRPTIWDIPGAGPDAATEVFPVTFADGSVGLLPHAQIEALHGVVEYSWEDELMDWNQNCSDSDLWVAEPHIADDEEANNHIVHHLASLRMRTTS